VAGLRAGHIYNQFPLMGPALIPAEYGQLSPWIRNWFENPAAAQFNHRWLAVATALAVLIHWFRFRASAWPALRTRLNLVAASVGLQFALGITVLLLSVPVVVGVAHQAGALLVLTTLTLALREVGSR
jgi:cytochrome c oxidase assembly protein subunit 15